jgi:hypothetical protein
MLGLNRYKSRVTQLMSVSLGRQVRLSSVKLHLLPRPSFVLTDLTVEEDPAYGAEPILHASTVSAAIRLLSLWRGHLEISTISVDEASLNLVRTQDGRWNLGSLFRSVAVKQGPRGHAPGRRAPLPSLEATNSRINVKQGVEKLPFSLLNTDISFTEQSSGEWRLRLRGQPARTDLSLDLADTGIVKLDANGHQAAELRQIPVALDMEWREAQLGQLMRLVIGADPGWRGDLTGDLHVEGTAEAAQVRTRLRAEGVHRAEFAPVAPMDFDANCAFVYHYSSRALESLACDSPLGIGRIHLAGGLAAQGSHPDFTVELARIPVQAGLDALRTVRSGFGGGLEARGTISGKIAYGEVPVPEKTAAKGKSPSAKARAVEMRALTGSLTVEGFQLSGDGLSSPIRLPKLVLEPAAPAAQGHLAIAATVAIPAGAPGPLTVNARLALSGYRMTIHGQAGIARARELAHASGMRNASALDGLAGDPMGVDLVAEGPWIQTEDAGALLADVGSITHHVSGTLVLHNANWMAPYLANHLQISQATLQLGQAEMRWDPVAFSYGPVKGTGNLAVRQECEPPAPCLPHFEIQFYDLDAAALQAAILGAREPDTVLSTLIDRLRPQKSAPGLPFPRAEGSVKANSLTLGPVTLSDVDAAIETTPIGFEIAGLNAGLLGGRMHAAGTLETGDKPVYALACDFTALSPAALGTLLGLNFTGAALNGNGNIELSGFSSKELAASAKGALHFDWRRGAIIPASGSAPQALAHFDRWSGDAEIANGAIAVKQSQVLQSARKRTVETTLTIAAPAKMTFAKEMPPKR